MIATLRYFLTPGLPSIINLIILYYSVLTRTSPLPPHAAAATFVDDLGLLHRTRDIHTIIGLLRSDLNIRQDRAQFFNIHRTTTKVDLLHFIPLTSQKLIVPEIITVRTTPISGKHVINIFGVWVDHWLSFCNMSSLQPQSLTRMLPV